MKMQKIAASIAAISMLASAGSALAANPENVTVNALVNDAITLSIAAENLDTGDNAISFDVNPTVSDGQDQSQSQILTVESNSYDGYTLTAALTATDATADALSGTAASGNAVFTSAADGNSDNYFQFMVDTTDDDYSVVDTDALVVMAGAGTEYSGNTVVRSTTGAGNSVTNGDDIVVDYDFNVDFDTIPDTYSGTLVYTLTATGV